MKPFQRITTQDNGFLHPRQYKCEFFNQKSITASPAARRAPALPSYAGKRIMPQGKLGSYQFIELWKLYSVFNGAAATGARDF
jgi:hypothetical protein